MRFIHTADWHLGNKMHNIDRKQEFEKFLFWLKDEVNKQKADALIVAGDIFDTANPPTEARTQYIDFLASLLRTECRNVIITGGNHDSGILLDSEKEILKALNIHVVGTIANLEPEDMVFELYGEEDSEGKNKVIGICAAVPYVHEIELRKYYDKEVEKGKLGDYANKELYRRVYEAADKLRAGRNIPVIATGHLYAANLEGRFSGENSIEVKADDGRRQLDVVGNLGSVHVSSFPEEFDYIALGHIHYPTMVAKNPKIRYSGSPFVLGFDEHGIQHCVLSVEINDKTETGTSNLTVEKIPVPETVIYKRITGTCQEIESEIKKLVKDDAEQENHKEINIEVNYIWEDGVDINALVERMNGTLPENIAIVHKKRSEEQNVSGGAYSGFDDVDVSDLSFEEIFKGLIIKKFEIDKTNLTEEEIKAKQDEAVEKFLPLFMETVNEYEKGIRYENQ